MKPSQRSLYLARFSLMLAVIFASSVSAQEDPRMWETDGVALRQGTHLEWDRKTAMQEDGSVCVVWSDAREGNRNIYAQMIDPDGNAAWEEGGVCVVGQTDCQEFPVVAAVEGGWIIAWAEYVPSEITYQISCSIYAQKLDMNGANLWRADGVFVESAGTDLIDLNSLQIVPDMNGGALIAWSLGPWDAGVFAQRVNSAGVAVWTGAIQAAEYVSDFEATPDGAGNMLLAWTDTRDGSNYDVFGAKLMADGSLAWGNGANGLPICTAPGYVRNVLVCPDYTNAGMYCVWEDRRDDTGYIDLYMQRIDSSGLMLWEENGLVLCGALYDQRQARIVCDMNDDIQNGFVAVWADYRVNGWVDEIYAQKVSEAGTVDWEENGVRVCGNAGLVLWGDPRENPWVSTDYAGGAVFTWSDTRSSQGEVWGCDLYAARMDEVGNNLWGDCGVLVQDGNNEQTFGIVTVCPDASDAFVAFTDWQSGSSDIDTRLLELEDGSPLTETSTRLIEGLDGDARDVKVVSMNNGRIAAVWEDHRVRLNALYYQIIDAAGETLFDFGGKQLAPDNEDWPYCDQAKPEVCPDGFGGFYAAFRDVRTGVWLVRLSHVNADGEIDCDSAGTVVWEAEVDQERALVAADGEGGCFVAWSGFDINYYLDAYVMHMNANCQPTWAEPVRLTDSGAIDDMLEELIPGANASSIVSWKTGENPDFDIEAARILMDGTVDWSISVYDDLGYQYSDKLTIAADEQGGAFFVWSDHRNTGTGRDIYAQHVSAEGAEFWSHNGIPVCTGTESQWQPQVIFSPENGLYIVWSDYRSGESIDLYAQRMDAAGNLLWPETGLAVSTAEGDQYGHQMLANDLGGFTCVWSDQREIYSDIYGTDILPDGSTSREWWIEDSGGRISTAQHDQYYPVIAEMGGHSALVVWMDGRAFQIIDDEGGLGAYSSYNLYMQKILTGSIEGAEEIPGVTPLSYALHQNYPNPFNPSTTISFSIAKAGPVSLTVYDLLGRSVATLLNEHLNSGSYQVPWDAGSLPSGMYFYRLTAGEFQDVKKTVLLK